MSSDTITEAPKRPWRDYRVQFVTSERADKDVNMLVYGPNAGEHFAGAYTLDELIEVASDVLAEALRRKLAQTQQSL